MIHYRIRKVLIRYEQTTDNAHCRSPFSFHDNLFILMYFPFCNLRFLPYQKPFCYDTVLSLNGHTAVIYQKFQQLFFIPYLNFSSYPPLKYPG